MKSLKDTIVELYHENRMILFLMIVTLIFASGLFVFSLTCLDSTSSVVKVGYGDIGGYRDGNWTNMIAFSIFALVFGILHNMLTLRIYKKRGSGMAKMFLVTTMALIFGTLLVLLRLSSEV